MNLIAWIVLGGLAGWVASIIAKTDKNQGIIGNIVVGILGAFLGGWILTLFGGEGITGFDLWSFVVAVGGAVILLFLWSLIRGRG